MNDKSPVVKANFVDEIESYKSSEFNSTKSVKEFPPRTGKEDEKPVKFSASPSRQTSNSVSPISRMRTSNKTVFINPNRLQRTSLLTAENAYENIMEDVFESSSTDKASITQTPIDEKQPEKWLTSNRVFKLANSSETSTEVRYKMFTATSALIKDESKIEEKVELDKQKSSQSEYLSPKKEFTFNNDPSRSNSSDPSLKIELKKSKFAEQKEKEVY